MLENEIFKKFTNHLKNALKIAGTLAKEKKGNKVEPIDLLHGILMQPGSLAAEILHKSGLAEKPSAFAEDNESTHIITIELSQTAQKIITKTLNLAFEHRHLYVGTEHLLMAILLSPDVEVVSLLKDKNISAKKLKDHIAAVLKSTSHFSDLTDMFSELLDSRPAQPEMKILPGLPTSGDEKHSLLELFTTDLTDAKVQKRIDPVIGRQAEIERLIQILSRRNKNNPLLLGDPGVGKTAIVEGLAKKITSSDVPSVLAKKKILSLDLGLMIAGTMYRGEFESRLKNILEEIKNNPNLLVFIDEIHNIIGAGSTSGGTMDAANLIKPALARGEIRCIGATTQSEYHKYIESDPALERRFQTIQINEPAPSEVHKILIGLKKYYEDFHQVKISDESIATAVELSIRYIPDKFLPDKTIDLIDEAASRLKINRQAHPWQKDIAARQEKINELTNKKNQAIAQENYDQAIKIKTEEALLRKNILELKEKIASSRIAKPTITSQDIAMVVSQITGIPLSYLTESTDQKIITLEKRINRQLIGQPEAVDALMSVIKRAQLGLSDTNRPIGSFLFLGPSGVGKTEMAKVLAREYFGDEKTLIRIDMSEFTESFNISKLIGAPAGYVGYREGGKITDAVRRRPYSVVLFDEMEKAHADVFNLLLQILDEGTLTDAEGRKINFRHTIIILTSNIASEKFNEQASFGFSETNDRQKNSFGQLKKQVINELEDYFRPELINRLDKIIVFNPLTNQELKKIVRLKLNDLTRRLKNKKINLEITGSAVNFIANHSFAPNKGAREIKRNIASLIEQPLANKLMNQEIKDSKNVKIGLEKNSLKITL